jgi:hypothetical protein
MVNLTSLLMGFDLEVGAWTLFEATGISDDGHGDLRHRGQSPKQRRGLGREERH